MPENKSEKISCNGNQRGQPSESRMAKGASSICKVVTLNATIQDVWKVWTTEEGCATFFAPACRIDLRVGGSYEMYFSPGAKPGLRGGEGCTILAIENESVLSFTWNAPPEMPEIRAQFTHVTVYLEAESERRTRLSLIHDGWGVGELWNRAFAYFDKAWGEIVLPRLQQRFISGPIDWQQFLSREKED